MQHRHLLAVVVSLGAPLACLLQGCGGGADAFGSEVQTAGKSTSIRIEGCVVDQHYIPHEGVAVRALSPDGQTLAYATSGRRGEVIVSVPAGMPLALKVDRDDGEWMSLPARDRDSMLDSCLVAHTRE